MSEPLIQLPNGDWVSLASIYAVTTMDGYYSDATKTQYSPLLRVKYTGGVLDHDYETHDEARDAANRLAAIVNAAKTQAPADQSLARDVARIKAALAATGHLLTDDPTANDRRANLYAIGGLLKAFTEDVLEPERTDS